MENDIYIVEVVVRLAIKANSYESAYDVAKESMTNLNNDLADQLIFEWDNPFVLRKEVLTNV